MPTENDTIYVTGRTKASANEKEERIVQNDMARSHLRWRKRACGRIGKK
jgi:hypothetical protein